MGKDEIGIIATVIGVSVAVGVPLGIGLHSMERRHEEIKNRLERLEASQEIRVENVLGNQTPEKFYEINGERVYLEIDGKPVGEYIRGEQ